MRVRVAEDVEQCENVPEADILNEGEQTEDLWVSSNIKLEPCVNVGNLG